MTTVSSGHVVILCFAGLLVWALVSDGLTLRIPNRISAAIFALFPAWVLASGMPWELLSESLVVGLAMLLVGFIAFESGLVGGGDAKLLAAVSLWSGLEQLIPMLLVMGLAGGLLSIGSIMVEFNDRRLILARGGDVNGPFLRYVVKLKLPYGVAIALGGGVVAVGLWTG